MFVLWRRSQLQSRVRELEQQNDEYETKSRMAAMDLESAQEKLEPALEQNAMYKMELEELQDAKAHLEQELKGTPHPWLLLWRTLCISPIRVREPESASVCARAWPRQRYRRLATQRSRCPRIPPALCAQRWNPRSKS